jgi:hypothetical protein
MCKTSIMTWISISVRRQQYIASKEAVFCQQKTSRVLFATVPDSSINSWESWFIFNLRKINTNQYPETTSQELQAYYEGTRYNMRASCTNYYTYLNSYLLEAPRGYVLHGLVPGLNWVHLWPLPLSMHLVATPNPVSCCLLHRVGFHT